MKECQSRNWYEIDDKTESIFILSNWSENPCEDKSAVESALKLVGQSQESSEVKMNKEVEV